MKKTILVIASFAALCGFSASSDQAYAPPGKDNISFGYGAAYMSSGLNTNIVCLGTDAGMNTANNRDCVFIGANAGKGMSGKAGAVVIGDGVFVHTNGVTTIKGFSAESMMNFATKADIASNAITNGGAKAYADATFADRGNAVMYSADKDGQMTAIKTGYVTTHDAGDYSFSQGKRCVASGTASHAEGYDCYATNVASHAEGTGSMAYGYASHAEGGSSIAYGEESHAEGINCKAHAGASHAEGSECEAHGYSSHAEGNTCFANYDAAHAEGVECEANGEASHAEGVDCKAIGYASHAQGQGCTAAGDGSFACGNATVAYGEISFAFGADSVASNDFSIAIGVEAKARHEFACVISCKTNYLDETFYESHGEGTFNVETQGGIDGFWIGETNLPTHIRREIGATFKFENGQFCVYTNGAKAGVLTFTPAQ